MKLIISNSSFCVLLKMLIKIIYFLYSLDWLYITFYAIQKLIGYPWSNLKNKDSVSFALDQWPYNFQM